MSEKVLVGVITYEGEKRCRKLFFDYLSQLTYPDVEFVIVTNSGEGDKKDLEEHIQRIGIPATILVNDVEAKEMFDHLVNNRNIIREHFLKTDKEWLYFIDSDCLGPADAIEVSLSHKKNLVTGFYLGHFQHPETKKWRVLPVAYLYSEETGNMQLSMVDVLQPRFTKISAAGLGCCLIHRSILEKISFRRTTATEDFPFFEDARKKLGEHLWIDTRIKFKHLKYALDDERNKWLNPDNYQMNIKKKE
ncbi:glycosyltransferase family 2 protein [Candidatus Woesearchaeota archaeon]|nr:glycosyltransferase family 2 protein [Candidatus Woesearchaeota archaeon]